MIQVFVTRRIPDAGLRVLEGRATVAIGQTDEERALDRSVLLRGVREADVLLSLLTEQVDRELLEANPGLLGVANHAVGFDNVDVAVATELGIPVSNTPGVLTEATADLTWALLLAVARRIVESDTYVRKNKFNIWSPNLLLGADVGTGPVGHKKVLGIVGFGRIGQAVARRAAGFDMEVLAHDPSHRDRVEAFPGVRWSDLDELLATADFVCLHPRLSPATRHLIDEARLGQMKPTAYLVNVSRGEVVDEAALVRALREGWIAGAALDVYEDEPGLAPGLTDLPNAVLVPHIGSASKDTRDRMAVLAATNALSHLLGERAPHCVNPRVYETEAWRQRTGRARAP
jgi:glyoxylate reductase